MKRSILYLLLIMIFGCKNEAENESAPVLDEKVVDAPEERKYKVLDSKFIDNDSLWMPFEEELSGFSSEVYEEVKALVFEKSIPEIQEAINSGNLTYEELSLFYLTRIREYDRENEFSLNSIISLNPDLIKEAREKDIKRQSGKDTHPIFGIPVLLKDNINTNRMPTTAGAEVLKDNVTVDAFVVKQLRKNGALILGKANLSEWAYFFCGKCPSGYSAVGGQTLNPYGRKIYDTGGSSSGSGVAVSANLAPVAVGSETSGSILSPSSSNSIVGLKPTIGLLSRGGIVPISSTLDTPGPMTRNVIDNAILLSAMTGLDDQDPASVSAGRKSTAYHKDLRDGNIQGKRFGVIKSLLEDSLYVNAIANLKKSGAVIVEFEPANIELTDFVRLLNLDMKKDLPAYFSKYGGKSKVKNIKDIVGYNKLDSLIRAPYGQALFLGILQDSATSQEFKHIKDSLQEKGIRFLREPMQQHNLDAILSINNKHAGYAAVAHYPAITVPMGYANNGMPMGLTFIGRPFSEKELLNFAYIFEQTTKHRKTPANYNE